MLADMSKGIKTDTMLCREREVANDVKLTPRIERFVIPEAGLDTLLKTTRNAHLLKNLSDVLSNFCCGILSLCGAPACRGIIMGLGMTNGILITLDPVLHLIFQTQTNKKSALIGKTFSHFGKLKIYRSLQNTKFAAVKLHLLPSK